MIIKLGDPPLPVHLSDDTATAKIEHVWQAARRYAKRHGYRYISSYGVEGIAPT